MGPVEAVKTVLMKKYATFSGRAARSEYWWFVLFSWILSLVIFMPALALSGYFTMLGALSSGDPEIAQAGMAQFSFAWLIVPIIINLALLLPTLAVLVRRLHDRNLSGWWILGFIAVATILSFIPILGQIIVLVMYIGAIVILALPGDASANRFGQNPLDPNQSSAVFS